MDFSYSKTEELFLQMIRSFAENEVKPLAAEVDETERFPMETVKKMAKLGLMGIPVPRQYGGAGGSVQMYIMAVEELSKPLKRGLYRLMVSRLARPYSRLSAFSTFPPRE